MTKIQVQHVKQPNDKTCVHACFLRLHTGTERRVALYDGRTATSPGDDT